MMILSFFNMTSLVAGLCISLALLLFIIIYRSYLVRYIRKLKPEGTYCELHRLEQNPVQGEVELYFTCTEERAVELELLDEQFKFLKNLAQGTYKAGGHIVRIDTTQLANGTYYYQMKTENQKTFRQMVVSNGTQS